MLEVVPTVRSPSKGILQHAAGFPTPDDCGENEFMVVDDDVNLLDYIDFTCCDVVPSLFDADGDILPDLEVDPTAEELLAEFEDQTTTAVVSQAAAAPAVETKPPEESPGGGRDDEEKKDNNGGGEDDEVVSAATTTTEDDSVATAAAAGSTSASDGGTNKSSASADKGGNSKKTKPSSKNSHGGGNNKKKVDWTPELHRRFVQAVEQLGIDKAVPTRILEIMGIDSLTRHNIASHLQKYRSHRKHQLAREAEAATWAHRRQQMMYAAKPPPMRTTTTIGFPPLGVRPLHVWGHPPRAAVEGALLPVWPRHLQPPPPAAAYWHQQQQYHNNAAAASSRKWTPASGASTQTTMPPMRSFPVPGMMTTTMPPHPMYYRPVIIPPSPTTTQSSTKTTVASLQLQLDAHPSKESIDAAIGDVLVKPWLPLPLGLKPPSLDSVMSELHKQGIPDIPPPPPSDDNNITSTRGLDPSHSHQRRRHLLNKS